MYIILTKISKILHYWYYKISTFTITDRIAVYIK